MKTSEIASYQILGETVKNVQIEQKRKDTWPKHLNVLHVSYEVCDIYVFREKLSF